MRLRLAGLVGLALLVPACAPPPQPPEEASAVSPPPPAPTGVASSDPGPAAPPPTASADEGPPPHPPMSMRYDLRLPSVEGRPWTRQHLTVQENGDAHWVAETGGGDGAIDEELTPHADAKQSAERCAGHVGPALHRRLVEAARRAMEHGCKQKPSGIDAATTTLEASWEGGTKSCAVERSGGSYVALERARTEAVALLCKR